MAPLIAPGIARFTVNQSFAGQPVANILDVRIDTTGSLDSRLEACTECARDILSNWDDHIRISQADDLTCLSVSWVDMNSESGSTGEVTTGTGAVWPAVGGGGSAPFSANVAVLVTKVLETGTRNRRNGRMYLCGGAETWTTAGAPNQVDAATRATLNANLATFVNDVNNGGDPFEAQWFLGVTHTTNVGTPEEPDIVFDGFSDLSAMVVQPLLATQRRRLR